MKYSKVLEQALGLRDAVLKKYLAFGEKVTAQVTERGGKPMIRVTIHKLKRSLESTHFRHQNIVVEIVVL